MKGSMLQVELVGSEEDFSTDKPLVSVIIPVYNDAARLQKCLASLARQTYPSSMFEIIVVDNGSSNHSLLKEITAMYPMVRLVYEAQPGSYAARNRGIAVAQGEILAFTDADCIPKTDWIEQGVLALQRQENCGLVAGRIEIFYEEGEPQTPVEYYEWLQAFRQEQLLHSYRGGATANLFTYRVIIDDVGLFSAHLKSGGDLEWGQRVYERNYAQIYAEEAQVAHPARHSWSELIRKTRRVAGGVYDLYVGGNCTSWWHREKTFYRLLFNDLRLALVSVSEAWTRVRQKPTVLAGLLATITTVATVSSLEKIRLKLGGQSRRC